MGRFLTSWLALLAMFFATPFAQADVNNPASGIMSGYQGQLIYNRPVTIASGQTASLVIDMHGFSLVGVLLPAAFTGTALTFQASVDGTNFFSVHSTTGGTALSYTVAQGGFYAIDPSVFYGIRFLKIVSGSAEAAARTLTIALKGI